MNVKYELVIHRLEQNNLNGVFVNKNGAVLLTCLCNCAIVNK